MTVTAQPFVVLSDWSYNEDATDISRALDAIDNARSACHAGAVVIADHHIDGMTVSAHLALTYRRAAAGLTYARAVLASTARQPVTTQSG